MILRKQALAASAYPFQSGIDKSPERCYHIRRLPTAALLAPQPYGAGAFLVEIHRERVFFIISKAFPEVSYGGEVIVMYVTWELLFTFLIVIMDLLALVVLIIQNNKKK